MANRHLGQEEYNDYTIASFGWDKIEDTAIHKAGDDDGGGGTFHPGVNLWRAIQALTQTEFDDGTASAIGDTLGSGDVIQPGQVIHGVFTQIQITTGKIIAVRG